MRDDVSQRTLRLTGQAYQMYGLPGLQSLQASYLDEPHQRMVLRLAARMDDPSFIAEADPADLAEYHALLRNPAGFVPCQALRHLPDGEELL